MKELIIMDIASIVKELGAQKTMQIAKEYGFLFWDSGIGRPIKGIEPKVVKSKQGQFENIITVDINKTTEEQKKILNEFKN